MSRQFADGGKEPALAERTPKPASPEQILEIRELIPLALVPSDYEERLCLKLKELGYSEAGGLEKIGADLADRIIQYLRRRVRNS